MAYFDSPKNRVKWEIELEELRQQKEDFAAGRLHDTGEIKRGAMAEGQHRKPVTFEQLEREEASASRRREAGSRDMSPGRKREVSKPSPSPSIGPKGGMKRIRSPLLLAAMALLAAGLTLWGSADRSFAGQTDQGYGAGGEARELDKEAQESMFSYQVEGEPESPYGEGSQELERLLEALGMEVPTLLPEEAAGMEKVVDPPMNFLVSKTEGLLDYTLPDGSRFSASVPQGMTVTDPVTFKPVENAILTILRNGSGIETSRDGIYSQPGKYHIRMVILPTSSEGGSRLLEVNFRFTILPREVSLLNLLKAPEGFAIEKMELDGRGILPDNPRWHFLHGDGRYKVRFAQENGGLFYDISFKRDTQAPLFTISPVPDKKEMKDTVFLELTEDMTSLEMYYNGRMAPIPIKRLELAGLYQFRLWDRAGNERYYQIRIAERLRPPSPKTIIITILGVGAAAGWFFYQRRHPRFL